MSTTLERRTLTQPVQFRSEDGKLRAGGYAYVFGRYSQNLGGFVEQVQRGAGAHSIVEQDIVALANHDPNLLLGRMSAGTLRLTEDERGGLYEVDLPDTTAGRDWATLLERRDVIGSSFGFHILAEQWSETDEGFPLRTLTTFSLRDVGPVTFPAYSSTEAALRSLATLCDLCLPDLVQRAKTGTLIEIITDQERSTDDREPHVTVTHREASMRR